MDITREPWTSEHACRRVRAYYKFSGVAEPVKYTRDYHEGQRLRDPLMPTWDELLVLLAEGGCAGFAFETASTAPGAHPVAACTDLEAEPTVLYQPGLS